MIVILSKRAINDIATIQNFISKDSPERATKQVRKIFERLELIGEFPKYGRVVPEYNNDFIREIIEGRYRIIYKIKPDHIQISRAASKRSPSFKAKCW